MDASGAEHILMSVTVRRLRPAEWDKLPREEGEFVPDPTQSVCIVAMEENEVVGRIFLVAPMHAEGIFIDQKWRGQNLMARLVEGIETEAKTLGLKKIFAYAANPEMEDYIERLGYAKQPWTVYAKELS
jgi:N-acetylglutamate synthase-like GNAT family acetyltransferase